MVQLSVGEAELPAGPQALGTPAAHRGSLRPSFVSGDPEPASVCKRNFWGLSHRRSSVIAPVQDGPDRHFKAGPLQQWAPFGPGRHSSVGLLQQRVSGTAAIQEGPGRASVAGALQQRLCGIAPRREGPGRHSTADGCRLKASLLAGLGQESIPEGANPSSRQDALEQLVEQLELQHGSTAVELGHASCADGGVAEVEPGSCALESSAEAGRLVSEQQAGRQEDAQALKERDAAAGSHEGSAMQVRNFLSALPCHAGRS